MRIIAAFGLTGLLLTNMPPVAPADAFRCGSFIIREGMPAAEIREKCGAADLARSEEQPVYARLQNGGTVQVGTEKTDFWYYDRGPNQYVARIAIRDELAEEIELLAVRSIEDLRDLPLAE
jgi:hypothetical protein